MHRSVVTGGAGFLGSHLCEALLDRGDRVLALDDFSTGTLDNVSHLLGHPNFACVEHDVTEAYFAPADRIYNLACPASPVHYQRDPVRTVITNVEGTIHGLRLARKTGARFLQASTSEVYGDPDVHPQPETYLGNVNPIGPRACYDEGKRCAETLCFDFHRQEKVDIRVARIFNTYGPRMAADDGRVVSNFVVQSLRGNDITVYGNGDQTRSFCFVSDMVEGLIGLMEQEATVGPVNLGNPHETTIRELAETIVRLSGSKSKIVAHPLPVDDPRRRRPDVGLASRLFGFSARVGLSEGLLETIGYFESLRD